jgi:hypothetical protein
MPLPEVTETERKFFLRVEQISNGIGINPTQSFNAASGYSSSFYTGSSMS